MKLLAAAYPQAVVVRQYSVRPARADDADVTCAIYNEGIADRATLETEPRTPDERRSWIAGRDARHPVVVVEFAGVVVGWASLNVFNPRDAYRHVADISVYVARAARAASTSWSSRGFPPTRQASRSTGVSASGRSGSTGSRAGLTARGSTSCSWSGSCEPSAPRSGPEIAHSGALCPPNGAPSVQSVTLGERVPAPFR